VNNNFGINTAQTDSAGLPLIGATVPGDPGFTLQGSGVFFANSNTVMTGGPSAVTVLSATGDFAATGLQMKLDAVDGGVAGSVGSDGKFLAQAASNASITISYAGGTSQVLTATGINSDTISGVGTSAGIVLTLANPGTVTSGDIFTITESAALTFQVGANAGQTTLLNID